MPAMLEDPTKPAIYRTSGAPPYPKPNDPTIPLTISIRQVTLRDRITIGSLLPFSTASAIPPGLLTYLCSQFNLEIEKGDTYPMTQSMPVEEFGAYWFQNFGAIMLLGEVGDVEQVAKMEESGIRWEEVCLGSFYVKPNYPGRSSHVCNGGFLVTEAARNRGVGRLMGEGYLEWAPKLGYSYSIFNLVYETNVASCRIWDALGFKRVGRVKGCGNLKSYPNELVDAIIYGRDLGPEGEDYVSEERFDKIRYYLKHGKYPNGADRAEKSRLRSAATHYKLLPAEDGDTREDSERLMLKDKEVVSDPQRQYEIARKVHAQHHGGINKTTAIIAEKYHWVRIKETVSLVIKNCPDCKDTATKPTTVKPAPNNHGSYAGEYPKQSGLEQLRKAAAPPNAHSGMIEQLIHFDNPSTSPVRTQSQAQAKNQQQQQHMAPIAPIAPMRPPLVEYSSMPVESTLPVDPQLTQGRQDGPHDFPVRMGQIAGYNQSHNISAAQTDGDMHVDQILDTRGADTRMASERHVRRGDDPDAFQDPQGARHDVSTTQTQHEIVMEDHYPMDS